MQPVRRLHRSMPSNALEQVGRFWSVREVLRAVEKDAPFYQRSGGGATLWGASQPHNRSSLQRF